MADPSPQSSADDRDRLLFLVAASLDRGDFGKLVLAKPRGDALDGLRVSVRTIALRGTTCLSFVHSHATRDVTKNVGVDDGVALLRGMLEGGFDHAHLFTASEEVHWLASRKGRQTLRRVPLAASAAASAEPAEPAPHDRAKHRFVAIDRPFLAALGVTDARGALVPAMARKWKQINKFVEVVDHAIARTSLAERGALKVVDFGAGKGYLTFALHDHLHHTLGLPAQVVGVELRADMVALCNAAVQRLALAGLVFEQGDVQSRAPEAIDLMIALHACDTATDHAIHAGIRAGAAVIVCSPCCHKEVRPQMAAPALLRPMLQHGIHLGQQAEMVTDSLRALLLEAQGYATQVFEFVALEHTSKNKMILATKRAQPEPPELAAAVREEIAAIKNFYGIREQQLERLLAEDAAA
jgi:hypothetical protein